MRGIVLAWAVGLGIMSWRTAQQYRKPPVPGRILGASAVYAALALLAEYQPATRAAVLAAWGFDVAVFFKAGPAIFMGPPGPPRHGFGGQGLPGPKEQQVAGG